MKGNISGVLLRGMPLEYKDNTDPTSNVKSGGQESLLFCSSLALGS